MTRQELEALFIRAAETEKLLPMNGAKPVKNPRGYVLQWVHETADVNLRRRETRLEAKPRNRKDPRLEKLEAGDDPLDSWRWDWLFIEPLKVEQTDVTNWELCLSLIGDLVTDAANRRALWAWSHARVGGMPFKVWCRSQGLHEITGRRRKNRALDEISVKLVRDGSTTSVFRPSGVLPVCPETGHVDGTIGEDVGTRKDPNYFSQDAAFKSFINVYELNRDGVKVSREGRSIDSGRKRKQAA